VHLFLQVDLLDKLLLFCKDEDELTMKLAILSALSVFKDTIPGYKIRNPTEKEQPQQV
jgi:nucleolar complex protein 3